MILNEKLIKTYSSIGSRATFGLVALELVKENKKLMVLTADVSTSAGLDRFRKTYPDNYVEIGIAEQNLIGVASGLSSEGFNVFTTTFSPFQTLRCCEQIKVNLGYMKEKVVMVGLASGLVLGSLGFTHCSIEDIGVLRSIPNITILSPADCGETAKCVYAAANHHESVYIRLTGGSNNPPIYNSDYKFEIGKAIKLRDGEDVTIYATGNMVHKALNVASILNDQKISASVINVHTIKPIDVDIINEESKKTKLFLSIEEHNIIGGLSSSISEVLSKTVGSPKLISYGVNDYYEKGGDHSYLQKNYGLDEANIVLEISNELKKI